MIPTTWPCPTGDGAEHDEFALTFDGNRTHRVLVVPALFDEGHKLRRFAVEVMRRLDATGIDSMLPDLPGTNESLADLRVQTLDGWRAAMLAATNAFKANRVLALRGGALIVPKVIPGWAYSPVKGASILRQLIRARILAARELGREERQDDVLAEGAASGLQLGGYALGAAMVRQLQDRAPEVRANLAVVDQDTIGGSGLWLRAEPDEDRDQADALAAVVAMGLAQ